MKNCKRCLMPDSRPGSVFDGEGICQACRNFDKRAKIDWAKREAELRQLCDKYRRNDGYYDCLMPVSGGKDSHFLVYMMKEKMGMNPLLVTVGDPFTKTNAGTRNYRNLGETFNCDHILFDLGVELFRKTVKAGFEERLEPLRFVEACLYTVPFKMSVKLNIPLMVYGENSSYDYGSTDKETASALDYILDIFKDVDYKSLVKKGISKEELNSVIPPTQEEMDVVKPSPIFMSYYTPWSSVSHLELAKRYGFVDLAHEWKREGYIEDFEQIDSVAYILNIWFKFPKFGFQRISDIASRRVREGRLTKLEAMKLIMENDHKMDQRAMEDFLKFTGYTAKEFWQTVDKFWNKNIFENVDGCWKLKNPVYAELLKKGE